MRKHIFLFILFVFVIHTQAKNFYKKEYVENKNFCVKLESKIELFHKIAILNVKVEGSDKNYRFLLDTGSETFISKGLAEEIGMEIISNEKVTDDYTSTTVKKGIASFTIGGIEFKNIVTGVDEFDITNTITEHYDGTIGCNLMRHCVWQFKDSEIIISSSVKKLNNLDNSFKQKLILWNNGYPVATCGFLDFYSTMMIDLGANNFVTIKNNRCATKRWKKASGIGINATTAFGNGNLKDTTKIWLYMADNFHFTTVSKRFLKKGWDFLNSNNHVNKVIIDAEMDDNVDANYLGVEILDYYNITFDFPKKKLYTEVIDTTYNKWKKENFGFVIMPIDGVFKTGTIWNNSQAEKLNIKSGCEILKINDLDLVKLRGKRESEIYKLIDKERDKTEMTILLKNDNIIKSYTLKKESLFL
ncbi:MAG: aspartyl protease family protein [Hyphomicrobiales bacterium]